MKIVVTITYEFEISDKALIEIARRKGIQLYPQYVEGYEPTFWTVTQDQWRRSPRDYIVEDMVEFNMFKDAHSFHSGSMERTDSDLIAVLEEMGSDFVNGEGAELRIIEIPDNVKWEIVESESGGEHIEEPHQRWYANG